MSYHLRLPKFEYVPAATAAEACNLLAANPGEARLLAGGTDLILQLRRREIRPRYVIGLKGVAELAYVREQAEGGVTIGGMTTIHTLLTSPLLRGKFEILAQTAAGIGSPEIRHLATLGGNLAGALPCADFPSALITLGAKVKLQCRQGERLVPVEDFFAGCGQTVASPSEILTEIQLPPQPSLSGGVYLKFHDRHSMDMTTTGVGAFVICNDERRTIRDVRIALASSAPVPMRAKNAEAVLRGRSFGEDALEEAASLACAEADPRTSWRATRDFRMELLKTLTKRAIQGAWQKAVSSPEGKNREKSRAPLFPG